MKVEGAKVRRKDAKDFQIQPLAEPQGRNLQFQTSIDQAVYNYECTAEQPTELFKIPQCR